MTFFISVCDLNPVIVYRVVCSDEHGFVCSLSFAFSNFAVLLALCSVLNTFCLRIKDKYFLEDCRSSPFH